MLYRAIPPSWLADASIRGMYDRLMADYPTCRFAGVQSVITKSSRQETLRRYGDERSAWSQYYATSEVDVDTLLLPTVLKNAQEPAPRAETVDGSEVLMTQTMGYHMRCGYSNESSEARF
ncbi:hypothetical protein GQ600_4467 [Phytophthora cactorum]|nr:hypothetical protein GQ600_4467 [Phytophthora cactorum]